MAVLAGSAGVAAVSQVARHDENVLGCGFSQEKSWAICKNRDLAFCRIEQAESGHST
jgi:hypothetical protein